LSVAPVPTAATAPNTPVSGLERLTTLSDGVYAIAATLLAIDLRLPLEEGPLTVEQLHKLAPATAVYALSFVVIGLFWVSHHRMFALIVGMDYALVWLNIFLLMVVAFLPVPNRIFGHYSESRYAALLYAGNVALAAFANILLWFYASHNRRHVAADVSPKAIRSIYRRHATTILVHVGAMTLAFKDAFIAFAVMVVYALASIGIVIYETRPRRQQVTGG
jgi:uncharacterized membrane protein